MHGRRISITIVNITYFGLFQRTSVEVDTANSTTLGLSFVINIYVVVVYISLFDMNKCNIFFKMSNAYAVHKKRMVFPNDIGSMIGTA